MANGNLIFLCERSWLYSTNYVQCCAVIVKRIFPLTNDWAPANKTLCSFLTTGAWHWSNSTKHSTPRQLQKWGQSQASEKRSRENDKYNSFHCCDKEYDTIFQGDWIVIGAIEKLGVVFLFVQTSFIIFSMACNQAVKPANWPDKVTRHFRDFDQNQNQETRTRGEATSPESGRQEDRTNIGTLT